MSLVALDAAIAGIKSTTSGKIEYQANSLATVLTQIRDMLADRFVRVADVTALQAVDPTESETVYVDGEGMFLYDSAAYAADPNTYAAIGGGTWARDNTERISTLKDVDLTAIADMDALHYDTGAQKFENSPDSVASLDWDNVTNKPDPLGADLGATDQLIKQYDVAGGTTQSIGIAARGNGNVTLTPMGDDLDAGTNSFVYAGQKIAHMTSAVNSFLATTMTQFRSGSVPFTVVNCVIIGDPGPLEGYFTGDVLQDVVAIGENGIPVFIKTATGGIGVNGGASQNIEISGGLAVSLDTSLTGDLDVAGNSTLGNLLASGAVSLTNGCVVTGLLSAGALTTTGAISAALTNYASNAAAITGLGGTGKLYRNGDNVCITH